MQRLLSFAFLSILSTVSTHAAADSDGKIYSGAQCQPTSSTMRSRLSFRNYRVENRSAIATIVLCPAVHDRYNGQVDDVFDVEFTAIDNNDAVNDPGVQCSIYSRSMYGQYVDSAWDETAPGATPLPQEVSIQGDIATTWRGTLMLRCVLPGYNLVGGQRRYSGLVSYRLTESD